MKIRQKTNLPNLTTWITPENFRENRKLMLEKVLGAIATNVDQIKIDESNQQFLEQLFMYFMDWDMPDRKLSNRKGLLLLGATDCGKTFSLRLFEKLTWALNKPMHFILHPAKELVYRYTQNGADGIKQVLFNERNNEHGVKVQHPKTVCLDDIGMKQEEINYYGNKINVLQEILYNRYELFHKNILTHATSNLDLHALREHYGERIASRIKEMFHAIYVKGKKRRKLSFYEF